MITVTKWLKKGVNFPFYQSRITRRERARCAHAHANLWSHFCVDTQTEWAFWNAAASGTEQLLLWHCLHHCASVSAPSPSRCLMCQSLTTTTTVASFPLFPLFFSFFRSPPTPTHTSPRSRHLSLSVLPLCRFELLIISVVAPLLSLLASAAARPPALHFFNLFLSRTLALLYPPSALPPPRSASSPLFFPPLSAPSMFLRVNSSDAFVEGFHSDGPF